jgi:hypothetical protein
VGLFKSLLVGFYQEQTPVFLNGHFLQTHGGQKKDLADLEALSEV